MLAEAGKGELVTQNCLWTSLQAKGTAMVLLCRRRLCCSDSGHHEQGREVREASENAF